MHVLITLYEIWTQSYVVFFHYVDPKWLQGVFPLIMDVNGNQLHVLAILFHNVLASNHPFIESQQICIAM